MKYPPIPNQRYGEEYRNRINEYGADIDDLLARVENLEITVTPRIAFVGDSWGISEYAGYYTGYFVQQHPEYIYNMLGAPGRKVDDPNGNGLFQTAPAVMEFSPSILYISIGRAELAVEGVNAQAWYRRLRQYVINMRSGIPGLKVMIETLPARAVVGETSFNNTFNAARIIVNDMIRQDNTDGLYAGLVDFAGDDRIGDVADMTPALPSPETISVDGLTFYDRTNAATGHDLAYSIMAPLVVSAVKSTPREFDKPENITRAVIQGDPEVGIELSVVPGTWKGFPQLTYQFLVAGNPVEGADGTRYTPVAADEGKFISVVEYATNVKGRVSATSNPVGPVAPLFVPVEPPVMQVGPTISGDPIVGQTLTCNPGQWTNKPKFEYQWLVAGVAILGATASTYQPQLADIGKNITCRVVARNANPTTGTATTGGVGPVDSAPGIDLNMPVPKMALAGDKGAFPPSFDIEIPVEAQAENIRYYIERADLNTPNVVASVYEGTITDAMANASAIGGLFGAVTVASTYRMRLETLDKKSYGQWSNLVVHGDVTAPIITTDAAYSIKEGIKLALPLTVSNEPAGVDWTLEGADRGRFTISDNTLRFLADGVADFENPTDNDKNNTYAMTLVAEDRAANISRKNIVVTVTDADEIVDDYSFEQQSNAAVNTDYERTYTVSGLEAGYSVPVTVSGGLRYKKNGGALTTTAGQVTNGDVITVVMKSAVQEATKLTGYINIGSVQRGFSVLTQIGGAAAIVSSSQFPYTYMMSTTPTFTMDFGVGTCLLFLTDSAPINLRVDGQLVTQLWKGDTSTSCYIYTFESTQAGPKVFTYETAGYQNLRALGVTVANVTTAGVKVTNSSFGYQAAPITVPDPVVSAGGVSIVAAMTHRQMPQNVFTANITVDRIFTATDGEMSNGLVGFFTGPGDAKLGNGAGTADGIYFAVGIALSKK